MRLLLDTHALVWSLDQVSRLSKTARREIAEPKNEVFVSAASAYEIALKHGMGRFPEAERFALHWQDTMDALRFSDLDIKASHGLRAGALPRHHGDPFDRLLIASAIEEGLTLVTNDPLIARYEVQTLW